MGIDLGVKDLAICSTGHIYKNINKTSRVRRKSSVTVIDIMMMLFDQDYAVTAYGWEQERKGEKKGERKGAIENTVKMCQRFGRSVDEAVHMLAEDFNLTLEKASAYVNKFWKNS